MIGPVSHLWICQPPPSNDTSPDEITSKDLSLFGNEGIGEYSSTKVESINRVI